MELYERAIKDSMQREEMLELYDYKILGLPVWNLIRYNIREKFIINETGIYDMGSNAHTYSLLKSFSGYLLSLKRILGMLFTKKNVHSLFLGFSRQEKIGDVYIDKFVDPIITLSEIKNDCIYLGYGKTGCHKKPRLNGKKIVYLDFMYVFFFILSYLMAPFIYLLNRNSFNKFHNKISTGFLREKSCRLFILVKIGEALLQYYFFIFVLKKLKVKKVFGVSRILFQTLALAAKKRHIPVYEIQHGITQGPTRLYSGRYNPEIDPDYFLSFGNFCPKNVFGIPEGQVINIGYAFKSYVNEIEIIEKYPSNTILVISEPHISQKILNIIIELSKQYPHIEFHIRRHPHENFTEQQKKEIENNKIKDVTNTISSNIAILSYEHIVGYKSSVLYEAVAAGKKVGQFCFGDLEDSDDEVSDSDIFKIKSIKDFKIFIKNEYLQNIQKCEIYSDFNTEFFYNLIHE